MKTLKFFVVLLLVFSVTATFAKNTKANDAVLISHTQDQTVLRFDITSYDFEEVQTPDGIAARLMAPYTSEILEKGAPAVRKLSAAVIVPDKMDMQVKVLNSTFVDIENVDLAPSKGNLPRTIDPANVPYEYGPAYRNNAFYPGNLVKITDPYITRDYRGLAVIAYPFQYNPVTKVLRVYTQLKVKVFPTGNRGKNTLERRPNQKLSREFKNVYDRHYLNYKQVAESLASVQYTPLPDDPGNYLIICYNGFLSEMSEFVSWKQNIGYTVDLVDYSTIGSSAALKTYVENYYNTNGLTFLLLVGDHAQVPTSSTTAGDSDNNYGYIVGSDHYLDIFVGRFSAETVAHVQTQVQRTIHYERDVASSAAFFRNAVGMGSAEGPGHNGEYDYQHIDLLLADLAGYGYTTDTNHQTGGSNANLTSLVNSGTGAMFYCGHGSNTCWTCGWTFCSSDVDGLVNEYELPFIYSVACVVGNFKSITCFCESWMRATNNGNPTGSVAHAGSTINQSWEPPMDAQDEFVDLMVSTSGPKRTFGGVLANGLFKMIDINGAGGESMADTWTCFGDASVQLRTPGTPEGPPPVTPEPPVADFIADNTTIMVTESVQFTDQSTNYPTSWDWTFAGGTPATSTEKNPLVTYNTPGVYDVTLTVSNAAGTDTITKVDYITVTALQPPIADFSASSTDIAAGDSVTFTDQSLNNPTSWDWTFNGGTPSASTEENPVITYNTPGTYTVTLTAANAAGSDTETKTDYINVAEKPYCPSQGNTYSMEWIAGVEIGTMNNASGAAGYTDFTSITCDLTGGSTVNVTLIPGFSGSTYTEYWKIWIDYNGDHDFEDAGEEVFSGYGSAAVTGSFTVASGIDIVTRMRVSMKYASYPTPCETFTYGEVEDYTANIVSDGNLPPIADFTYIINDLTVSFTDTSTDPDGIIVGLLWDFGDGTTSTEQNPVHTYAAAGTYTVTLTVTDDDGATGSVSKDITVTEPNLPPIADFTYTVSNLTVTFTDNSYDPDGVIVSWLWDFGDGNTSTEQNPVHTYAAAGTYTVTLTVTDDDGASSSVSKIITVIVNGGEIYVYGITQTPIITGKNYKSSAVVTIWDTNNNPVANATVSITWSGVVSGSDSGITGAAGTVTFVSDKVKSTGPFTITVDNVTHATMSYNPALNNETSDTASF
ncbi:PKD domain-containing protein [Acidobacteriota bacterium]